MDPVPPMTRPDDPDEQETIRRRDEAVRRALNTPPQPHKPSEKTKLSPAKRTVGKGRASVGKSKD